MRKHFATLCATALVMACAAGLQAKEKSIEEKTGLCFGIGAVGGIFNSSSEMKLTTSLQEKKSDLGLTGGHGGICLMAGHMFEEGFLIGVSMDAMWGSAKGNYRDTEFAIRDIKLEAKDSYGADLCFGYRIGKSLPHLKVGVVTTKFDSKFNTETDADAVGSGSESKHKAAFRLGIGGKHCVSDNVAVGLSYDYAWYPKISYKTNGASPDTVRIEPRASTFKAHVAFML